MYSYYHYSLEREVTVLHQGEYLATGEDRLISTVLGSCVAVVLYDRRRRAGGMNHFILPGRESPSPGAESDPHYGSAAMSLLLHDLRQIGAGDPRGLRAHIFGGGNVLAPGEHAPLGPGVGEKNVAFAQDALRSAGISAAAEDTGGAAARKLLFAPATGAIYLKHLGRELLSGLQSAAALPDPAAPVGTKEKKGYGAFIVIEPER